MKKSDGMASTMLLVQQLVIGSMSRSHSLWRMMTRRIMFLGISFVFAAATLVFVLYAEYSWLNESLMPAAAALITALTALAFAAGFAVTAKPPRRKKVKKPHLHETHSHEVTQVMSEILELLGDEIEDPIRTNPKMAVMLASLAGFAAGERRP